MFHKVFLILLFSTGFWVPLQVWGQDNSDFQTATRYLQEERYEQALEILEQLYADHPDANIFFDRLMDSLVGLREYDRAISLLKDHMEQNPRILHLRIRKGELYHLKGDRDRAREIWNQTLRDNADNLQLYYQLGNTLFNRREYHQATELYETARDQFEDPTLFINENATAHMQTGQYAEAVNEYVQLLAANPDQLNYIQQRLLRMEDEQLFHTAAKQFEDRLETLNVSHHAYPQLHQLYTWLLIETGQYQKAYDAGRDYEERTETMRYSLFRIAEELLSSHEFELAAAAYRYYSEVPDRRLQIQSRDRLSLVYQMWASWLEDHHLQDHPQSRDLYRKSYLLGKQLLEEAPEYERRNEVLVRLAEFDLDLFHDPEGAERWIRQLENGEQVPDALVHYLRGRLYLYSHAYTDARRALTLATRNTPEGDLTERFRYYLSLADFFAGDYEFALLQLRTLERQHSSDYTNDAVKLRVWIQEGIRADTSEALLDEFSEVIEHLYSGEIDAAVEKSENFLDDSRNPLTGSLLSELSYAVEPRHTLWIYSAIHRFNQTRRDSPLRERLLWEEAIQGKQIVDAGGPENLNNALLDMNESPADRMPDSLVEEQLPSSEEDVGQLFEAIISEFPQGFYAPYARNELQALEQPDT